MPQQTLPPSNLLKDVISNPDADINEGLSLIRNIKSSSEIASNATGYYDVNGQLVSYVNGAGQVVGDKPKTNVPEIALASYRAIPNSTARKIAWFGDSTSEGLFITANIGFTTVIGTNGVSDYTYSLMSAPGQPFYNVTHGNYGASGHFLSEMLADTMPAGKNLSDVVLFAPDLIVFSMGINDVIYSGYTKAQLKAGLIAAIAKIQAALPSTPIILRMPNNFVYDSTFPQFGASYATCQNLSNVIYDAYFECIGVAANMYMWNSQAGALSVFTKACTVLANMGLLMGNALHPSGAGYGAVIRAIAQLIAPLQDYNFLTYTVNTKALLPPFPATVAAQATSVSSTLDYQMCPRVLEDTSKYNLILDCLNGSASPATVHWLYSNDAGGTHLLQGVLAQTDICCQYGVNSTADGAQGDHVDNGVAAYAFTGMTFTFNAGGFVTVTSLPAGYPRAQNNFQPTKVYRKRLDSQKNTQDLNFSATLAQANFTAGSLSYTVQRFSLCRYITSVATTGPTTGGTITVAKNGVTIATLTYANAALSATGSGTFFTNGTRGAYFEEGDIITITFNAGFVGGTYPKVTLSAN
jgi:lysophospholipase L1-like esterase